LVAGGGLVGVELVAELSERLKSTVSNVTLISRSRLLASLPPATEKYAMNWLNKQKNINLVLEDEVASSPSEGTYVTKKGRELQADIFIDCTFAKPPAPTASEKSSNAPSALSSKESAAERGDRIVVAGGREALSPYTPKGKILVDDSLKVGTVV
jgi:NADH dehydrogenase FAD-containing subunit